MSQESQQQPEATQPATQNDSLSSKAGKTQSFPQSQTIKLLAKTIQLLQGFVSKLETQTNQEVEQQEVVSSPKPTSVGWMDRVLPSFPKLQSWWDEILTKVRSYIPESMNSQLNDLALTGILTGLVVLVLLTTVYLLPDRKVAVVEPPPQPVAAPPELKAPRKPKQIKTIEPPPLKLTPEQSLIAAIQKQVAEITNQYAQGLIKSIEANFPSSRLIIQVGDGWYQLSEKQQNQLSQEMLRRSQQLDFSELALQDTEGNLIARNPVVGENMVIFLREKA